MKAEILEELGYKLGERLAEMAYNGYEQRDNLEIEIDTTDGDDFLMNINYCINVKEGDRNYIDGMLESIGSSEITFADVVILNGWHGDYSEEEMTANEIDAVERVAGYWAKRY